MIQQARLNPPISKTFTVALLRAHFPFFFFFGGGVVKVSRYLDLVVDRDGGVSPQVSVGLLLRSLHLLRNAKDSRTPTLVGNFQLFWDSKSLFKRRGGRGQPRHLRSTHARPPGREAKAPRAKVKKSGVVRAGSDSLRQMSNTFALVTQTSS